MSGKVHSVVIMSWLLIGRVFLLVRELERTRFLWRTLCSRAGEFFCMCGSCCGRGGCVSCVVRDGVERMRFCGVHGSYSGSSGYVFVAYVGAGAGAGLDCREHVSCGVLLCSCNFKIKYVFVFV